MRKAKKSKVIEIKEDVRIPGTDIILEKGDKIEVINFKETSDSELQNIFYCVGDSLGLDDYDDFLDELDNGDTDFLLQVIDILQDNGEDDLAETFRSRVF